MSTGRSTVFIVLCAIHCTAARIAVAESAPTVGPATEQRFPPLVLPDGFRAFGTDQDFVVKLIDVYPDRYPDETGDTNNTLGGYQQLVRGEIIRGKFRNSLEKPEPVLSLSPFCMGFVGASGLPFVGAFLGAGCVVASLTGAGAVVVIG